MEEFLEYNPDKDCVVVRHRYAGAASQVENFIRCKKARKLKIEYGAVFCKLPCVTFITELRLWNTTSANVSEIGDAISSMVLLEKLMIAFPVSYCIKKGIVSVTLSRIIRASGQSISGIRADISSMKC